MSDPNETRVTMGSGNVFSDLGFDAEEAENLRIRSRLMMSLRRYIDDEGLTQAEAADRFGVHQPRVSDLVRGKVGVFTIDALVNMHAAVGLHVEFTVTA